MKDHGLVQSGLESVHSKRKSRDKNRYDSLTWIGKSRFGGDFRESSAKKTKRIKGITF